MKTATRVLSVHSTVLGLLVMAACWWSTPFARAGLTVDVHLYHDSYGYYFYPFLSTNTTPPGFPAGDYQIASWQIPTNGSQLFYHATSTDFDYSGGGGNYYSDFNSFLYGITNQPWSIWVTNSTSTNHFTFQVTVTGLTSNVFGAPADVTFPANNRLYVTNRPAFTWTGPAGWMGTLLVWDYWIDTNGGYNYVDSTGLDPGTTSWTPSVILPDGTNTFTAYYDSNLTAGVVASTPTNTAGGQAISGWVSTAQMETSQGIQFAVGQPVNDFDPFLVARYDFEDTNSPASDSSGNGNDPDCSTSIGPTNDVPSTDAAVGNYARQYFGNTSFCFTQSDPAYNNLSNALSGNFSVTAWVKTTATVGDDYANAYFGSPIFFAGADYNDDCTIPLSITGSKAAFTIVATEGPGTVTLHSTTSVNDGNYHFLTVTREQSSGLMSLYVDGNLETTGTGITTPVITQGFISIAGGYYQYDGLLDDVRLYATNLSAADVNLLANSVKAPTLASAVGSTNLVFATSGDANWLVENTNTYKGAPFADQSGSISNYQSSTLTATVTGPGTLTFYWSSVDNDPNQYMDYEFAIDDLYTNDIADLYGANDWQSIEDTLGSGPIAIPPGQHTLIWTVFADNDADPFQAGFLDDVVFAAPDTNAVSANITLNIYRSQDPGFGDIFICFPSFNSVTPDGTGSTTNVIKSPDSYFSGQADQGGGGSSSAILNSLDQLLNECTNGLWSLYINKGMPNERQFQFSASINGLTTNLLSAVTFITPTNGATGFPAGGAIQWVGPTDFSTLSISKQNIDHSGYVSVALPINATNWSPGLAAGSNRCDIIYTTNNFPGVLLSLPVDTTDSQAVSSWTYEANLVSIAATFFVVTASPSPVALSGTKNTGANWQFQFTSQAGFANAVQYRTNLTAGNNWQTYTNIPGDGSLKTVTVPLSLFSPSKQGFIRVSTH